MPFFTGNLQPESWVKDWPEWYLMECRYENSWNHWTSAFTVNAAWTSIGNEVFAVKKKNLEFSFSTEVQTGWRAWRIVDFERRGGVSEKRLQALGTSPVWEPYQPGVAICTTNGSHEAPWPTCKCGFWAFHKRADVEQSLWDQYGGAQGKVIGQIAMWGRVLECTRGFRGEFAYPQTLQFIDVDKKTAKEVAANYGVPYSHSKPETTFECGGYAVATEWDYDRLYVTIQYKCGTQVRAEVSRNFKGKRDFDTKNLPPCPHHH